MDSFEQKIIDCVNEKLNDGTVERLINEKLEKGISEALDGVFGYSGKAKKAITSKIEETMVPVIESHDFNQYLVKLDTVLTEIINNTSLADNKEILKNFSQLMKSPVKDFGSVPLSRIYQEYQKYVSEHIDTDNLEIDYDDEPSYSPATTNMEIEDCKKSWFGLSITEKIIHFTCDEDEDMSCDLKIKRYEGDEYNVDVSSIPMDICSLRSMSKFEIFIKQLKRAYSKIDLDIGDSSGDAVEIEDKPEASFS